MTGESRSLAEQLQFLNTAPLGFSMMFNPHKSFEGDFPSEKYVDWRSPKDWISKGDHAAALKDGHYIVATMFATTPGERITILGRDVEDVVFMCVLRCKDELNKQIRRQEEMEAKLRIECE